MRSKQNPEGGNPRPEVSAPANPQVSSLLPGDGPDKHRAGRSQPPGKFQIFPLPWTFLAVSLGVLVIQLNPQWREALLYDRGALGRGEWWRIWSGHLVHFGWPHWVADAGLFFILGWLLEARHPCFSRLALVLMPAFISAAR